MIRKGIWGRRNGELEMGRETRKREMGEKNRGGECESGRETEGKREVGFKRKRGREKGE